MSDISEIIEKLIAAGWGAGTISFLILGIFFILNFPKLYKYIGNYFNEKRRINTKAKLEMTKLKHNIDTQIAKQERKMNRRKQWWLFLVY